MTTRVMLRLLTELAQLSDKELDAKVRELVNWDFRLNLDEGMPLYERLSFVAALTATLSSLYSGSDASSMKSTQPMHLYQ